LLRKPIISAPSTARWSAVSARYIIGRTAIWSFSTTTGRFKIASKARMPTFGGWMMGVPNSVVPHRPVLVMTNV